MQIHIPSGAKTSYRPERICWQIRLLFFMFTLLPLTQRADSFPQSSSSSEFQVWNGPPEALPDSPGRLPFFQYYIIHISIRGLQSMFVLMFTSCTEQYFVKYRPRITCITPLDTDFIAFRIVSCIQVTWDLVKKQINVPTPLKSNKSDFGKPVNLHF